MNKEENIKDLLKQMVGQMKHKGKLHQSKIRTSWEQLMGATIASYTSSISLRKHTVYISITSAPLRNELNYSKDKIKDLLNNELGENLIEKVVIR